MMPANRFCSLILISLSVAGSFCSPTLGQEFDPSQEFDDELPEFLPGLIGQYKCQADSVTRVDDDLLFQWDREGVDPRMPRIQSDSTAEPLTIVWQGLLQAKARGEFRLHIFTQGQVEIRLGGQVVLSKSQEIPAWMVSDPVELSFGRHELEITFQSGAKPSKFGLYWSGPNFELEPIAPRYLWHAVEESPSSLFEEGSILARGLRCAACHTWNGVTAPLAAPALTHLQDNLRPSWLVQHLTAEPTEESAFGDRAMPFFGLHHNSAAAVSATLFKNSEHSSAPENLKQWLEENAARRKKDPAVRTAADPEKGAVVFASKGCIACHQVGDLGTEKDPSRQLFGGGNLAQVAVKRTPDFLARWLEDPAKVNPHHRMPNFELSRLERLDLAEFLGTLGADNSRNDTAAYGDQAMGVGLVQRHRCGACHELPASLKHDVHKTPLSTTSDWQRGCLDAPDRNQAKPGFGLQPRQREALKAYITNLRSQIPTGERLLVENNCLNCHQRDLQKGLAAHLPQVAEQYPETAARLAALAPPAITGVGDKLTDEALLDAIRTTKPALRPWLDVRMPKFKWGENDAQAIAAHLIGHDRIPDISSKPIELPNDQATELAAARLVTSDGFGCQSCHAIGDMEPPKVDLKAQGTNLAMLAQRIRPSWFHRWVRNPARIVPRMEMPAIQVPAAGVLRDDLDMQLEALWKTLNTPDFRPPRPGAVRVVRCRNIKGMEEHANVVTSVIETPEKTYLRPLIVGLPNRHNVMFDLESGGIAAWWLGDTARQHTRGKTWYWEPGAEFLHQPDVELLHVKLIDRQGEEWTPAPLGQFAVQLDAISHVPGGIRWEGRLHVSADGVSRTLPIQQLVRSESTANAVRVETRIEIDPGETILLQLGGPARETTAGLVAELSANNVLRVNSSGGQARLQGRQSVLLKPDASQAGVVEWSSTLQTNLPLDVLPPVEVATPTIKAKQLECVPGYESIRLPLPSREMPISFAWGPDHEFFVGSLKGHVLRLHDDDQDGLHERYEIISDQFPTPFGLAVTPEGLDVLAKFALIRLKRPTESSVTQGDPAHRGQNTVPWDAEVVADGWGYTADYHDWAIGLEQDPDGNYYISLPCQQDDRTEEAAYLRGHALKLVPIKDSAEQNRRYRLEPIAAGLRFPIGIALNREGALFTTDNQGNYNPFNELNHLRQDKRYGFINKLENKNGFSPEFESPAINLPHPWSRSVNGICFLHAPASNPGAFGPFEGHLIGCEMNGRSLVRLSLQKVGDTYQGAAYMFSLPGLEARETFEGPIVCEVSPQGDLFVGSLQDSGWGGGNNTGSIVRLRPNGELPLGIAEVRANATGFQIEFTQAIDPAKAAELSQYEIRSYRRVSTPAYGGDDQDERAERPASVVVVDDRRVELQFDALREGCVYEFNIANIGAENQVLFPSQAHYTLRTIPQ